jgi:hypothetical protein
MNERIYECFSLSLPGHQPQKRQPSSDEAFFFFFSSLLSCRRFFVEFYLLNEPVLQLVFLCSQSFAFSLK